MAIKHLVWCMSVIAAQAWQVPETDRVTRLRQGPVLVGEVVFTGTVTSVEDGDSIVVKTPTEQMTLQIAGVDAPELSQPGGAEARTFLTTLVSGKTVTVRLKSVADRIGSVQFDDADVSEALIRSGMAWHCPRFTDDRGLTIAEADARASKRGLWRDGRPTPPWLHRGSGACWQQHRGPGSER